MTSNQEWQPVRSRNERMRMRTSSGEESDVERVSPHTQTTQTSEVPQGRRQGFPKFKALSTEGTTSYAMVAKLEKDWLALRSQVTARPNVYCRWVITPRTQEAFNTLSQICFTQLRPEEKITKYILLHYPMEMSLCHIQAVERVQKVIRCSTKDGSPTRQVEVHLTGEKREHLDLGLWGCFKLRLFIEEPMRCFKCQRFLHHKATCHNRVCCAICSGRHETSVCIKKHKEGQVTIARCLNCKGNHHAWNPKCPERLRLIQTGQRQATAQPRRETAATPRRQTISVTVPSTSGTSRTVSFAETLKGVHKLAPTPKPQREKRPPRQRKATNTAEQPSSPTEEENSHRERKGPAHLVKSTAKAKAKAETKMVSAQIQTSPVPAPAKEAQTPRRERKKSVTQTSPVKTPVTKTPATLKEGAYNLSGHQLVVMMQTFATALEAQLNITLQTEQVKKATRATLSASKFLTKTSEDKTRRQNKMSISLDAGMNTSMEIIDH